MNGDEITWPRLKTSCFEPLVRELQHATELFANCRDEGGYACSGTRIANVEEMSQMTQTARVWARCWVECSRTLTGLTRSKRQIAEGGGQDMQTNRQALLYRTSVWQS